MPRIILPSSGSKKRDVSTSIYPRTTRTTQTRASTSAVDGHALHFHRSPQYMQLVAHLSYHQNPVESPGFPDIL